MVFYGVGLVVSKTHAIDNRKIVETLCAESLVDIENSALVRNSGAFSISVKNVLIFALETVPADKQSTAKVLFDQLDELCGVN